MDNLQSVLLQMEAFGIELRDRDLPLKFDTTKSITCGKKGKDWYKLYLFRPDAGGVYVTGTFGTYRNGGSSMKVDWKPDGDRMSDAEFQRMQAERAASKAKNEAARRAEVELAAMDAVELMRRAKRTGQSPYLDRKGVVGESCRYLADGTLVLPLMRYDLPVDQRLRGVQRILPNGTKLYTKGFDKPGCCTRLGSVDSDLSPLLLVCEGYATGLTARMATQNQRPVFVALDAGNLLHVVPLLRRLYPRSRLLILADDDWQTRDQNTGELTNPGLTVAKAVAKQVPGCDLVYPIFSSATRGDKDTDFNDLQAREGADRVRAQLSGVVAAMSRFYG